MTIERCFDQAVAAHFTFIMDLTRTMSAWGMPSVMHTTENIFVQKETG